MRPLLTIAVFLLSACITDTQIAPTGETEAATAQERLGLTDLDVAQILLFLNDCTTDLSVLDDDVPLDADAALALIEHRDGRDGTCGTGDDRRFDDLEDVDDVPQVGDASILAILDYLYSDPEEEEGEWEGVVFTDDEVEIVLEIVNQAAYDVLDIDVELASDAAENIVNDRPHDSMDHLAATAEVGPSALEKLKAFVPKWDG